MNGVARTRISRLGIFAAATLGASVAWAQPDVPGAGFAAVPGQKGGQDMFGRRIQKFRPRPGANPQFLVGKPWKGVW